MTQILTPPVCLFDCDLTEPPLLSCFLLDLNKERSHVWNSSFFVLGRLFCLPLPYTCIFNLSPPKWKTYCSAFLQCEVRIKYKTTEVPISFLSFTNNVYIHLPPSSLIKHVSWHPSVAVIIFWPLLWWMTWETSSYWGSFRMTQGSGKVLPDQIL